MGRAPVAVVDLGSNSARLVVYRRGAQGVLEVVADEHVSLQLIRAIDKEGRLRKPALERTLRVLRDFSQVAGAAGAKRIFTYGTAALREARNKDELVVRARKESGLELRIMDSDAEGRAGFLGAVYGLPVRSGVVFDIGGGSLQVTQFQGSKVRRTVSLPLGALRVSDEFLTSDPPTAGQVRRLRAHVHRLLGKVKITPLKAGEAVVGTGGTVRNLAKLDSRRWEYPISRLHGYDLSYPRLRELTGILLARDASARASLNGLNTSRVDSIVGGSIVAESVVEACKAKHFLVAGQGLREGIVLDAFDAPLASVQDVRERSVAAMAAGFTSCDPLRARRRTVLVTSLYRRLEPYPDPLVEEMLTHAATLLDVGRSVDYYRLHTHTAAMVRASGLLGFSHREIALLSSIVEMAKRDGWDLRRCTPPLHEDDYDPIERAGLLLFLAEVIEQRRTSPRATAAQCRIVGRSFVVREPGLSSWDDSVLAGRFKKVFARELKITG